ncbi:MAG: M20/M25/M40 family metallo-hydrolase [Candidatus Magasanikbacteria bacterium]
MKSFVYLTRRLINFRTYQGVFGAKDGCFDYIIEYLSNSKIKLDVKKYKTTTGNALVICNKKISPNVCLCGHIDVVSARVEQFRAVVKGDRLYGRGAIDMKGAVAVMVEVIKNVRPDDPSVMLILVDDEEQSNGFSVRDILGRLKIKPRISIIGEQTDFNIVTKQKGVINIRLSYLGKKAHGAQPEKGVNAIEKLFEIVGRLVIQLPFNKNKGGPTCILSQISGGEEINSVPEHAWVTLNIRYTSKSEAGAIKNFLRIAQCDKNLKVTSVVKPCFEFDSRYVEAERLKVVVERRLHRKVGFISGNTGSDAKYFSEAGLPAVVFGPVGRNYHADNEWVSIKSLGKYYQILNSFINNN